MKFPKLNSHTRKGFFGKVAVLFLVVLCVFTVTFSFKPSEAEAVTIDPLQFVKEWVLDNIERVIAVVANIAKQKGTYSFINEAVTVKVASIEWNEATGKYDVTFKDEKQSAFEYIENPEEAFRNLISREAAIFTETFKTQVGNDQLPEGFKETLARELAREAQSAQKDFWANFEEEFQTNITDEQRQAFNNDFTEGGWGAFLEVTQNCASNYECTRITLIEESLAQRQRAFENKEREIATGEGAQNIGKCLEADKTGKCVRREGVSPSAIASDLTSGVVHICSDIFKDQGDEFLETIISMIGEEACSRIMKTGISRVAGKIKEYEDEFGGEEGALEDIGNKRDSEISDHAEDEREKVEDKEERLEDKFDDLIEEETGDDPNSTREDIGEMDDKEKAKAVFEMWLGVPVAEIESEDEKEAAKQLFENWFGEPW